jgi:hypothetical protein
MYVVLGALTCACTTVVLSLMGFQCQCYYRTESSSNEGKSGGNISPSYVLQLLFCENHIIAYNSTTTEAREKISTYLEYLEF